MPTTSEGRTSCKYFFSSGDVQTVRYGCLYRAPPARWLDGSKRAAHSLPCAVSGLYSADPTPRRHISAIG